MFLLPMGTTRGGTTTTQPLVREFLRLKAGFVVVDKDESVLYRAAWIWRGEHGGGIEAQAVQQRPACTAILGAREVDQDRICIVAAVRRAHACRITCVVEPIGCQAVPALV